MHHSIRTGLSITAFAVVPTLGFDSGSVGVALANAEVESADECVDFSLVESEQGLAYELANACEKRLSCQMSWTLVCGNDRSGPTHPRSRRFAVAENGAANINISVAACGSDSWLVEDIAWACDPR